MLGAELDLDLGVGIGIGIRVGCLANTSAVGSCVGANVGTTARAHAVRRRGGEPAAREAARLPRAWRPYMVRRYGYGARQAGVWLLRQDAQDMGSRERAVPTHAARSQRVGKLPASRTGRRAHCERELGREHKGVGRRGGRGQADPCVRGRQRPLHARPRPGLGRGGRGLPPPPRATLGPRGRPKVERLLRALQGGRRAPPHTAHARDGQWRYDNQSVG
mmetsp:Transcript_49681/g.140681  ORF Transcript_49681/g.140681 Transcript_49681/m.140681 type:complete len:219 (+) Transcript_49681:1390-2046(+)